MEQSDKLWEAGKVKTISCSNVITDLIKLTIMKIYLDNITSLLQTLISLLVLITNNVLFATHLILTATLSWIYQPNLAS